MLATVERFMARYGTGDADSKRIRALLEAVSAQLAREAGRVWGGEPCLERGSYVHVFTVHEWDTPTLMLPARPVVSVSQVKEAIYGAFSDADALVEGDDYHVDSGGGRLHRVGEWLRGERTVQVVYAAGYTGPDVSDADGFVPAAWASGADYAEAAQALADGRIWTADEAITASALPPEADPTHWTLAHVLAPADLVDAALLQAGFAWQRRGSLGVTGEGVMGGSVSWVARVELLPQVRDTLEACRRRGA